MKWIRLAVIGGCLLVSAPLAAETPSPPPAPLNVAVPTLGGVQFWSDVHIFHDWRIQRNSLTGHCRLLDGHDIRQAWGTEAECRTHLDALCRERSLSPVRGRAVIVLHGLFSSRKAMAGMADYLHDEGGFTVVAFGYPSTRADIHSHAEDLGRVIDGLEEVEEINFVAHSLGNLVIRRYLSIQAEAAAGRQPDPRIKRIVMLTPPNHGTAVAETFGDNRVFAAICGPAAVQIAKIRDSAPTLATPAGEFGIIAGGLGHAWGYCPFLEGDDDGIVPVASTRLAGAADFAVLPVPHCDVMDDPIVREYTLRFLDHGHFRSADQRQPIESAE
jgi:hypothetical protein